MRLVNGWTGGQYSLLRLLFGAYLLAHFAALVPYGPELFSNAGMLSDATSSPLYPLYPSPLFAFDDPVVVRLALVAGCLLAAGFALGAADRLAALLLWFLLASLAARNPLVASPGLPFVGWLLLAHAALPPAPYGSLGARGRSDPAGGWQLSPDIFAAAWMVMALAYAYSGYTRLLSPSWIDGTAVARVLESPLARPGLLREGMLALPAPLLQLGTWGALALELLFAPLALLRALRPWLWLALLGLQLSLMALVDFAELSAGMLLVHAFTFDPAWLRPGPARGKSPPLLYYDGTCGLCQRALRFVLSEDQAGSFRFAPLGSEHFTAAVPAPQRDALPDSLVLDRGDGVLLVRSAALLELARRLGGVWRAAAAALSLVPAPLLDPAYDALARVRHRLFARPEQACPALPPHLRQRFLP